MGINISLLIMKNCCNDISEQIVEGMYLFDTYETITKTHYSNILKISAPKTENFQIKNSDIFHTSAQNLDCGYSLEPPRTVYPQSMF